MPSLKLTKRAVDSAEIGAKRTHFWDENIAGFWFAGHAGRGANLPAQISLRRPLALVSNRATWSPWTLELARREALRLLGEIARGVDPAAQRADDRKAMTFEELSDLHFAEGVAHKKPSTLRSDLARARIHLMPALGKRRADSVTRGDIERLLNIVMNGRALSRPAAKRGPGSVAKGGAGAAAQCVALASTILQFGVQRGVRSDNPARGVKKPAVRKMQRFLTLAELRKLADSLDEELALSGATFSVAAIRLLALTGCRRGEIVGLRWAAVDLERRLLHLTDSKTREKTVYLSPAAAEILASLPRIYANPFVIAAGRGKNAGSTVGKVWVRVSRRERPSPRRSSRRSRPPRA